MLIIDQICVPYMLYLTIKPDSINTSHPTVKLQRTYSLIGRCNKASIYCLRPHYTGYQKATMRLRRRPKNPDLMSSWAFFHSFTFRVMRLACNSHAFKHLTAIFTGRDRSRCWFHHSEDIQTCCQLYFTNPYEQQRETQSCLGWDIYTEINSATLF